SDRLAPQPGRPVLLNQKVPLAQRREDTIDFTRLHQVEFVGEDIEADTETIASAFDVCENRVDRGCAEDLRVVRFDQVFPLFCGQLVRDFADVLALVAIIGKSGRLAQLLQVARSNRLSQQLHLTTPVVEVVLARARKPRSIDKSSDSVSEHSDTP